MLPQRCGAAPRACHLGTAGRTTLRGNLLDPAKTNMFAQVNRMYECVTLFETPLNGALLCRVAQRPKVPHYEEEAHSLQPLKYISTSMATSFLSG